MVGHSLGGVPLGSPALPSRLARRLRTNPVYRMLTRDSRLVAEIILTRVNESPTKSTAPGPS